MREILKFIKIYIKCRGYDTCTDSTITGWKDVYWLGMLNRQFIRSSQQRYGMLWSVELEEKTG